MASDYRTESRSDPINRSGSESTAKQATSQDYNLDTGTLCVQAKRLYEEAQSVHKQQKKIQKKLQQARSKKLAGRIDKYNTGLYEMREAFERIKSIVNNDKGDSEPSQSQSRSKPQRAASSMSEIRPKNRNTVQGEVFSGNQTECFLCLNKDKTIQQFEDNIIRLENNLKRIRREHEDYLDQILQSKEENEKRLQRKYQEEKDAKDDALRRLSSMASSKLRDNNPNITDLSDKNRPTKIAEKLSELYDNQWTDAFDTLEREMEERQVIQTLLDTLMDVYNECRRLTGNESSFFERVQKSIILPAEAGSIARHEIVLPDQLKQQLKEFRKMRATDFVKDIAKVVIQRIPLAKHPATDVQGFVSQCIEIGWLCAVQDPPLVLRAKSLQKFDTNLFKDYTQRGKYVGYVVWPAVFLSDGGALLAKGVAQGTDHVQTTMEDYSRNGKPSHGYNVPVQMASAGNVSHNQNRQRSPQGMVQNQQAQIRQGHGIPSGTVRTPNYAQKSETVYHGTRTNNQISSQTVYHKPNTGFCSTDI